jgi:hypothetical protein
MAEAVKLAESHGMPSNSEWSQIVLYDRAGVQVAPTLPVLAKRDLLVASHHGLK